MTDYFALFQETRRPWLDAEILKDKLHKLSAEHHPDVAKDNSVDFTELNAAYRMLHDPKTRLRHLLELEFPGTLTSNLQIPADISRLFETMARERHSVGAFLEKQSASKTPLETALMASEKIELLAVLEKLLAVLNQKHEGILTQIKFMDAVWEEDKASSEGALLDIYQSVSYVGKWIDQVREDILKMSGGMATGDGW
ncbi:MAG: DnaJ domain-containing protein [Chthoniobacteraceae bacterium]